MGNKTLGLPTGHLNIRGINKIYEMKLHLEKFNIKICHISESFLTQNIDNNLLYIPNFNLVLRDRQERHVGGVLTYISTSLAYSVLSELDSYFPESLTIKITQQSSKVFITSVIYRPPNSPITSNDQFF